MAAAPGWKPRDQRRATAAARLLNPTAASRQPAGAWNRYSGLRWRTHGLPPQSGTVTADTPPSRIAAIGGVGGPAGGTTGETRLSCPKLLRLQVVAARASRSRPTTASSICAPSPASTRRPTPRADRSCTVLTRWARLRPRRSSFQTTSTSPFRRVRRQLSSPGRSSRSW